MRDQPREVPANMDLSPSVLKAVAAISPCLPYRFENGQVYVRPDKQPGPRVSDQSFDGPA